MTFNHLNLELCEKMDASESELVENWPFNRHVTACFFFHGRRASCLKDFIIERDLLKFDYFLFDEDRIYCFSPPNKIVNLTAISYPNLVVCAIYCFLLELEKEGVLARSGIYWLDVLYNLLSPLIHEKVLDMLQKNKFFKKYPLQIIEGFLNGINEKIRISGSNFFSFYSELKNVDYFYNILTFVGTPDKEASTLAENCINTSNLNEIQLYLQSLYEKQTKKS